MATKNIIPRNNDEGKIGTNSKKWGEAHIVDGRFDTLSVNGQSVSGGGATSLAGLSDVTISSVQNNQVLKYNSSTSVWENGDSAASLNSLPIAVIDVANDSIAFVDATDNASKKESVADLVTAIKGSGLTATNGVLAVNTNSNNIIIQSNQLQFPNMSTGNSGLSGGQGGIVKVDLDNLPTTATVNVANDSFAFIDSDGSQDTFKESIADLIAAISGSGLTASSGVLSVSGVTNTMLSGSITDDKLNTITSLNKVSGSSIQLANPTALENNSGLRIKDTFAGSSLIIVNDGSKQVLHQINTIKVTVSNSKFLLNGISQKKIILETGTIYRFDVSDSSVSSHPFKFSTTSDGTHNSGSEYTTGVTTSGSQGSSGAYVQLDLTNNTVQDVLYYYCSAHSGMGSAIYTSMNNTLQQVVAEGADSTLGATFTKTGIGLTSSGSSSAGYISTQGTSNHNLSLDPQGSGVVVITGNTGSSARGSGKIKINNQNNTYGVTIQSPLSTVLTANYTLTLPANNGDADQVLKTDGNGVLSWVDQASGGGGGSSTTLQTTITSTSTLSGATSGTHIWLVNGNTSSTTVTLPNSGITDGTIYNIKNISNNSTYTVTVSGTIDSSSSQLLSQYDNLTIVSTSSGSQWYII